MPSLSEYLHSFAAVVVTGGSSGIGKSFISHIRKLDPEILICNLSRRCPDNADELKVRHFPCDLAQSDVLARIMPELEAALLANAQSARILLLNNSGFGSYGIFPEPNLGHQLEMIDVNVRAVVDLTGRLLPLLRARGGAIVNIASTAAFQPTPWMATYGATKAFVLNWSLALQEDLRGTGIQVLAVCPGPTATEFFRRAGLAEGNGADFLSQPVDEVVLSALRALAAGRTQIVIGWKNKLGAIAGSIFPKPWVARIARRAIARYRLGR
jgi:short-subunit dehydrogenase